MTRRRKDGMPWGGRWDGWDHDEVALLRDLGGTLPLPAILERVNAIALRPRTLAAARIKARKLGLSLAWHRSQRETARLFGVDDHVVADWIARGWLRATPWRRMGPHVVVNVADADLEAFIRAHSAQVDPARMQPGRWRALAEVEHRRDPWLSLDALARALGFAGRGSLARWRAAGLISSVRLIGRRGRGGRMPHRVRASEVPRIREAIDRALADRGPSRQAQAASIARQRWAGRTVMAEAAAA